MQDQGAIETIGRGLYRRTDATATADLDLLEIGYRAPQATLCLTRALAQHDLTDLIPASINITPPRGQLDESQRCGTGWQVLTLDEQLRSLPAG